MLWKRGSKSRWPVWLVLVAVLAVGLGLGARALWQSSKSEYSFRLRVSPPRSDAELDSALYQTLGVRLAPDHAVTLVLNGQVFDTLVERIAAAKSSVHVLMYIWQAGVASDRVVEAIVARARAGVQCRIVVDDVGSPDFAESVAPALRSAGCEIRVFRPLGGPEKLARNHRKLLVVDGTSAITGGFGIRDTWLGDGVHGDSWRDTNVLFAGPAVADAQQAFAENWQEAGGALLPVEAFPDVRGTGSARAAFISSTQAVVTRAERLTQLLIASAERRLWIANAYFVPSRGVLDLLMKRAEAGVDVRILAPYKNSDSKTAFGAQHLEYGELLKKGVKIWEYTSSMMHAKTMLVDDRLAQVGSINLDPLSLHELEEDALLVEDRAFVAELAQTFVADCERSKSAE